MHDSYIPHCGSCTHFNLCFRVDMVVEWGYCERRTDGTAAPFRKKLKAIKQQVAAENYEALLSRAGQIGLFVPMVTSCTDFEDAYPL